MEWRPFSYNNMREEEAVSIKEAYVNGKEQRWHKAKGKKQPKE